MGVEQPCDTERSGSGATRRTSRTTSSTTNPAQKRPAIRRAAEGDLHSHDAAGRRARGRAVPVAELLEVIFEAAGTEPGRPRIVAMDGRAPPATPRSRPRLRHHAPAAAAALYTPTTSSGTSRCSDVAPLGDLLRKLHTGPALTYRPPQWGQRGLGGTISILAVTREGHPRAQLPPLGRVDHSTRRRASPRDQQPAALRTSCSSAGARTAPGARGGRPADAALPTTAFGLGLPPVRRRGAGDRPPCAAPGGRQRHG